MKLDTHGIRFRFWIAFFFLALGITLLIGLLQIGLIRPYYRNMKVNSIRSVADAFEKDLIEPDNASAGISDALKNAVDNDVCVVIYNEDGKAVYTADSLGAGCIFNASASADIAGQLAFEHVQTLLAEGDGEYSTNMIHPYTEQEMIIYGKMIRENLANFYMMVNSPLEPVDSLMTFFIRQYGIYTLIAILVASFVAMYIAQLVTRPIVHMKKEAVKLAEADYSAHFDGGSFTETKQLAQALNTANYQLSRVDEMRTDLIANMSHDIRTPLTDIRAYAEMIRDISGDNPEKRNKHLDVIIHETEYMNRLVKDMSELAKMSSGNYELNLENMDLVEKTEEIIDMYQPMIQEGKLEIITEMPEYMIIYADEVKIGQVISNYLSNAIKHTPAGKKIFIRIFSRDDGETVRLEVEDEGEGISEKELPYIWDRYHKSSRSFSRSMTSSGLGLAIVKGIADAHHAKIGVTTKEGEGSTFFIELKENHDVA